ncbi:hypothetical protein MMC30_006463 [Trapelia coarctata]|nr:hypothetical protein [Trapelia coarctata]
MPPPSQLSIATSSLLRLVKEEASYHKELEQQQSRLQNSKHGGGDENADYTIKQEAMKAPGITKANDAFLETWQKRAIEETKAIFPQLRERIKAARENLELQLEAAKENGPDGNVDEITKAKEAVAQAKTSYGEIA